MKHKKGDENMTLQEKLFKYLPKKYHDRFGSIECEDGLIEDCKYIIYTSEDYIFEDGGSDYPCKSIKEAVYFLKHSVIKK